MDWLNITHFFILLNFILITYMLIKYVRCSSCDKTLEILNKNVDLLNSIYRKQHSNDLKKMVELYSEAQTILKISESSFISLFRYDYTRRYVTLHFLFSINGSGEIMHESYLDKLPATSNLLNLEILKSSSDDLYELRTETIKEVDVKLYEMLKYYGINKLYFRNITKCVETPSGYIAFSYKDDYELDESQREEILRIISKISELL